MSVLKVGIGTLDKASANEVYKLAKGAAVKVTTREDTYSRTCLYGGTDCIKEGGNPAHRDPHLGARVYIVDIVAPTEVIRSVLTTLDPHLGAEWQRNATAAVNHSGRVWWST